MKKSYPLLIDVRNTVYLEGDGLVILDRRQLPHRVVKTFCRDEEDVARAIEDMVVQGAGDIGIAALYGLYLVARRESGNSPRVMDTLAVAARRLISTRPTGAHLKMLVDRALERAAEHEHPAEAILGFIERVVERQNETARRTGELASALLEDGDAVLTHCFAGPAVIYMFEYARARGISARAVVTETRPYLQGARLTAWSLAEAGVEVTLITDNMPGHLMSRGMITKVFTAADRIARDGSVANKVGTFQLAVLADYFGLPFYILGYGGPDANTATGQDIPIEERDPEEVLFFRGQAITAPGVKAYYPAFDVTPPRLITGIVTDRGVFSPGQIMDYYRR